MDNNSHAYQALKNSSFSFVGYTFPIIFSIFVTPILVHQLGVENYGLYVLINTVIFLSGLLDLGLSTALIKHLAQYQATGSQAQIKKLLQANNLIFAIIGLSGLALMIVLGLWGNSIFKNQNLSPEIMLTAFCLGGLVFLFNTGNSVFAIIPKALQRFDISTKIDLTYLIAFNVGAVMLVLSGYKLVALLAWQAALIFIFTFVYRYASRKILPLASWSWRWHGEEIKKSYSFGCKTFISNLAGSSLNYLDRLLIPIFLGPTALTYYSLPGNVAGHIPGVTNSLTTVLFPMVASLKSVAENEKIKNIYTKSLRLITIVSAAITVSIIAFAYKILFFWIGRDLAEKSTFILIILTLTYFLISLSRPLNSFLLGLDKTKFLAIYSVLMALLNLILILVLLPRWGILGAAWAYLLSVLPTIFMFYQAEKNFLGLSNRLKDYLKLYLKIIAVGIVAYLIDWLILVPLSFNIFALIILGPLAVLIYLLLYRLFNFYDPDDLRTIKDFLEKIYQNIFPQKTSR